MDTYNFLNQDTNLEESIKCQSEKLHKRIQTVLNGKMKFIKKVPPKCSECYFKDDPKRFVLYLKSQIHPSLIIKPELMLIKGLDKYDIYDKPYLHVIIICPSNNCIVGHSLEEVNYKYK
ncbi:hypothetical protein QI155_06110 [Thermodesulfovibrio sp. 1176]|uniref:hypothetical protein n=1 Tax=Thermodesulfovibrio sp. 1176 TaxID=3043424 RepID=UPI0024828FBD|nr:hypothetical protein [Thermodesulfovibrio sp. 1176]MDI1472109.1 hypothetical protein [Thermodesulfovibrio sp. 1176]